MTSLVCDVVRQRLLRHRLIGEPLPGAVEAVRWLGAVQAQDYGAAKWGLAQRTRATTEAEIDRLFDQGLILRTHVLRPTWHFVLPEDVRWMLALTAPRIRSGLVGRYRELGIDQAAVARANAAFSEALRGGRYLTRPELGHVLAAAGISPEGQRLPHFLMAAELDAVIVSGPRRYKQFTYALLDDRVPPASSSEKPLVGRISSGLEIDPAHAAAELARRYFNGHAPAQLQDFVWWSGFTMADARRSVDRVGLEERQIGEQTYWSQDQPSAEPGRATVAHLLPNFDEYTVGYRDRSAMLDTSLPFDPALFSFGSVLSNVVVIDGRIRGSWRRTTAGDSVQVELRLLEPLRSVELRALEHAGARLGRFLDRTVEFAGLES